MIKIMIWHSGDASTLPIIKSYDIASNIDKSSFEFIDEVSKLMAIDDDLSEMENITWNVMEN